MKAKENPITTYVDHGPKDIAVLSSNNAIESLQTAENVVKKPDIYLKPYQVVQGKYMITSILKEDMKGDVFKAIYFNPFTRPKLCVIKQGRASRCTDHAARDMRDRMRWQKKVHLALTGTVNLPHFIDYFVESGDHFLVTNYIQGKPLEKLISNTHQKSPWSALGFEEKTRLLNLYLKILFTIKTIHDKGYVHRDLNHRNFIITRKEEPFLIDWELTYSIEEQYPQPVFQLGTYGFMSPEQLNADPPTVKEDIFALGGLLALILTNMQPSKFDLQDTENLRETFFFFTGDLLLADLAARCLSSFPLKRPQISEIEEVINLVITNFQSNSDSSVILNAYGYPAEQEVNYLISAALKGIINCKATRDNGLFQILGRYDYRSAERTNRGMGMGLMSPVLGILYLLDREKAHFYNQEITSFFKEFMRSKMEFFTGSYGETMPGLYYGSAGKALTVFFAWKCGIWNDKIEIEKIIQRCLDHSCSNAGIDEGISGQLFALVIIINSGSFPILKRRMTELAEDLLALQNPDGSWNAGANLAKKQRLDNGIENGNAGIILSLIQYDKLCPSERTKCSIRKGLSFISKKRTRFINPGTTQYRSGYENSLAFGSVGLIITLLHGFEHLADTAYRHCAIKLLKSFQQYEVSQDFSLATGLAGKGIVYLEAARILKDQHWLESSVWIYQVFNHTFHGKANDTALWRSVMFNEYDIGFLSGNAGLIMFLQKFKEELFKS